MELIPQKSTRHPKHSILTVGISVLDCSRHRGFAQKPSQRSDYEVSDVVVGLLGGDVASPNGGSVPGGY